MHVQTQTKQIAIDGPSGSGKSTLAKNLAKALGFVYIDTGALYRAVGLYAFQNGIPSEQAEQVCPLLPDLQLDMRLENGGNAIYIDGVRVGDELRSAQIARYASQVSKLPDVRAFLLETQRSVACRENVVMDGRDIGTVVLPNASVKLFLSASPACRAKRRHAELIAKGEQITEEQVLADLLWRDKNDQNRDIAPLVKAPDAVLLDTSDCTPEQTLQKALAVVRKAIAES